jgi:hypothetical protein
MPIERLIKEDWQQSYPDGSSQFLIPFHLSDWHSSSRFLGGVNQYTIFNHPQTSTFRLLDGRGRRRLAFHLQLQKLYPESSTRSSRRNDQKTTFLFKTTTPKTGFIRSSRQHERRASSVQPDNLIGGLHIHLSRELIRKNLYWFRPRPRSRKFYSFKPKT